MPSYRAWSALPNERASGDECEVLFADADDSVMEAAPCEGGRARGTGYLNAIDTGVYNVQVSTAIGSS